MTKERGAGWQGSGGGGLGRGRRGGGSGGGKEGGVWAHLVYVNVGGVEQDVVLAAEAGEDGGDAGHQLGEGGAALRLWVPALDHHRVAERREEGSQSGAQTPGYTCCLSFKNFFPSNVRSVHWTLNATVIVGPVYGTGFFHR